MLNPRTCRIAIDRIYERHLRKKVAAAMMPKILSSSLDTEPRTKGQVNAIVSLTTYGPRIKTVWQTIESLRWQTIKAAQIVLYLAAGDAFAEPEKWPNELHRLVEHGLRVEWVPDMGPYTKQIPAIQTYAGYPVVSFDDDEIYHPKALEQLWNGHMKSPQAIICRRAHRIVLGVDGKPEPYVKWKRDTHPLLASDQDDLVFTGFAGVLYPANSLDPRFSNAKLFRKLAPGTDDLWMYAMAQLNGTPTRLATSRRARSLAVSGTQDTALWRQNVNGGRNDIAMANLVREFGFPFAPRTSGLSESVA